jgi:hypothetical protein
MSWQAVPPLPVDELYSEALPQAPMPADCVHVWTHAGEEPRWDPEWATFSLAALFLGLTGPRPSDALEQCRHCLRLRISNTRAPLPAFSAWQAEGMCDSLVLPRFLLHNDDADDCPLDDDEEFIFDFYGEW